MRYNLSELCDIIGGGTPKTNIPQYWGGNIPWLSVKDFNNDRKYVYEAEKAITEEGLNNSAATTLIKGDIIISARGTVGEMAVIPYPMSFNQSCYGLRAKKEIVDADYLYYLVKFKVKELKHNAHGSVFDTITRDTFEGIEVDIPSKVNQQKIASILAALDSKIETNETINHNLEQQADAIFAHEFLELPAIPPGWTQGSLLDIANYQNGLAMQKYRPKTTERGIPVLKIKELRQGVCDDASELCSESISPTYIVQDGDVIFSWSGTLLVDFWCGGVCGLNQHLFKVTSDRYEKWFYYAWTRHHLQSFIAYASAMATTMGHIKRGELEKAEVLIPSPNDLSRIGSCLMPIYDAIISNRIENHRLIEIRDSLLPKLMSGEIDVSKTEI